LLNLLLEQGAYLCTEVVLRKRVDRLGQQRLSRYNSRFIFLQVCRIGHVYFICLCRVEIIRVRYLVLLEREIPNKQKNQRYGVQNIPSLRGNAFHSILYQPPGLGRQQDEASSILRLSVDAHNVMKIYIKFQAARPGSVKHDRHYLCP